MRQRKVCQKAAYYLKTKKAMTRSLTPSLTRDMGLSITVNGVVATGDHEGIEYNGEKNYRDHRPSSTARPITKRRPANWDPYVAGIRFLFYTQFFSCNFYKN